MKEWGNFDYIKLIYLTSISHVQTKYLFIYLFVFSRDERLLSLMESAFRSFRL